jgi:hypothetical protein
MFLDFDTKRGPWVTNAARCEDFLFGNQWTKQQIWELGEKGMAPLVINRTMPVILQEVSILTARRPQFRALPREDSDVKMSAMWSDILAYIHHISDGDIEIQQTARDYFTMGAGYIQVYVDHIADDGRGEVKYQSLPVWDVWPDPFARKLDLSDARAIIVSRLIPEDSLIFMYPEKRDFIRKAASSEWGDPYGRPQVNPSSSGMMTDDSYYPTHTDGGRRVRVLECYEKIHVPYVRVYHMNTGQVVTMPADRWAGMSSSPAFHVERFYRPRIRLTQTIGATDLLHEVVLPTSHYPIVPFYLHHARTPWVMGDVDLIMGLQQEINKRRSVNIHNAMLAGNFKLSAEEGSISNEEEYKAYGTRPGFILKHRKGYNPPVPMYPQSLPNSWYEMEGASKADLEYTLSVFSHMMGSSTDAPETYRALLSLEEAGQRKIQHKARNFNAAIRKVGLVCLDFSQALYTRPKLIRITGEDRQELREVWLNKSGFDVLTGELTKENDLSVGQYDLVVTEGSSMPTNRMAMLNLYLDMFQLGIVDVEEVIKKTDVVDREGLVERLGQVQQMSRQVQMVSEENKQLIGLNQTLRRQSQQLEVHLSAAQEMETMRDEVRQTATEQKLARARIGDQVSLMQQRLALAEKKVALDSREVVGGLMLQREKERALAEVERARRKPAVGSGK